MSRHAFGVALRRHRERLQLTQEALAHRSGISVRTVRDLETGRVRRPHGASVRLLADALELSGESSAEFNALALSETAAPPAAQRLVPRQLPADIGGFAGRSAALASLDGNLRAVTEAGHSATVISSIAGMAGIGKTALAVHWAHRVASEFPDGQLYVDLRGHSRSAPMPAIEALARFLRALGVLADQVPVEVDEAAALYRSLLAGRRVLVILDNAASAVQVRPLLPGGSASFVLITSRVWLAGLIAIEGANAIRLGVLPPNESAELLSRLIGPDRTAEEPQAATRLACLCAHLPLALRIAAANLSGDPYSSIAQVVVELAAGNRLDALQVAGEDQPAVLAAFDLSYQTLPLEARRLFGRFGVAPGTEFSADAAAALAGVDPPQAAATVNALVTVHLVEQIAPGRYGLHELLRIYARERALAEDPTGRLRSSASTTGISQAPMQRHAGGAPQ